MYEDNDTKTALIAAEVTLRSIRRLAEGFEYPTRDQAIGLLRAIKEIASAELTLEAARVAERLEEADLLRDQCSDLMEHLQQFAGPELGKHRDPVRAPADRT